MYKSAPTDIDHGDRRVRWPLRRLALHRLSMTTICGRESKLRPTIRRDRCAAVQEAGAEPGTAAWPAASLADEAVRVGRTITRIAVAFEAGRDGFWLARWLHVRGVEVHVIHASSVAVSREHRRAKTDRLDTELLKRGFLGWLRGERGHCSMTRVPTRQRCLSRAAVLFRDPPLPIPSAVAAFPPAGSNPR